MAKRIISIPTPGIANGAIPVFALPSADFGASMGIGITSLVVFRGGITLSNPAFVTGELDVIFGNPVTGRRGYAFYVYNKTTNPTANIVEMGVTGNISFFQIFNSDNDPSGTTLGASDGLNLLFLTSFADESIREGTNTLTGQWYIDYYFDGMSNAIETVVVNITYDVIAPYARDNKHPTATNTKISPNSYIDEFIILNNRVDTEYTKNRPLKGGDNKN